MQEVQEETEEINACQEADTRKALCDVQRENGKEVDKYQMGEHEHISETQVLRQGMHGKRTNGSESKQRCPTQEGEEVYRPTVRSVCNTGEVAGSPQGQECEEQFKSKPDDSVCSLSHEMALGERQDGGVQGEEVLPLRHDNKPSSEGHVSEALPEVEEKPAFLWNDIEAQVGRTTTETENRASRLRALGNGQVPLQAAVAFSFLLEASETIK